MHICLFNIVFLAFALLEETTEQFLLLFLWFIKGVTIDLFLSKQTLHKGLIRV